MKKLILILLISISTGQQIVLSQTKPDGKIQTEVKEKYKETKKEVKHETKSIFISYVQQLTHNLINTIRKMI